VDTVVDVAIVGGGIAGLSAAYELQRRGCSVRVLEASDRPGGVIRTERFDGWVVDCGPDALLAQKPAGVGLCRELGIADRLITTLLPAHRLRAARRPAAPAGRRVVPRLPALLPCARHVVALHAGGQGPHGRRVLVPRRTWHEDDDESIGAFVRRRFGHEAADYLADPLLAGIHAGDADELSVRTLFPRLVEAERQSGSVLRAFRAMKMTRSPQGAFVSLPRRHRRAGGRAGGGARPRHRDDSGPRHRDPSRRRLHPWSGPDGVARSRALVLCVPAYTAAGLLRAFDTGLAGACDSIPYASTATVAFGYRADQVSHPMQGTGFVVPKAERRALLAGTWVTSKWPGRAPAGHVLVRAFLGGGRDPHRLERNDDAALVQAAEQELVELLGHHRRTGLLAAHALGPPEPAVCGGPSSARGGHRTAAEGVARPLPRGQRLPRHRHPRLHCRRPRHRRHGGRVPETQHRGVKPVHLIGAPLDLGGGRRGVDMGPSALRIAGLGERIASLGRATVDQGNVTAPIRELAREGDPHKKYIDEIAAVCRRVHAMTRASLDAGALPVVLGGDHSVAAGLRGRERRRRLRATTGKPLGVIWVDAHGDMNTPQTSESGNVHGMPLAALLGQPPEELSAIGTPPSLRPEHTGARGHPQSRRPREGSDPRRRRARVHDEGRRSRRHRAGGRARHRAGVAGYRRPARLVRSRRVRSVRRARRRHAGTRRPRLPRGAHADGAGGRLAAPRGARIWWK
jgi:oxygen-dependent protoporphyrinogen oxidase